MDKFKFLRIGYYAKLKFLITFSFQYYLVAKARQITRFLESLYEQPEEPSVADVNSRIMVKLQYILQYCIL